MVPHIFEIVKNHNRLIQSRILSGEEINTLDKYLVSHIKDYILKHPKIENGFVRNSFIEELFSLYLYVGTLNSKTLHTLKSAGNEILKSMELTGSSTYFKNEELVRYDLENINMINYYKYSIKDIFDMSLKEYSDSTPYYQELLKRNSTKIKKEKARLRDLEKDEIDNLLNKGNKEDG